MVHPFFIQNIPRWGIFVSKAGRYAGAMELLPSLKIRSLIIALARHAAKDSMSALISELAVRGEVTVLDGGNRFSAYQVAGMIRRKTVHVESVARRLFIRRAFTCYQMVSLLEDTPAIPTQPYLILDLLATFYDDQVQPHEAERLLNICLQQIERLRFTSPIAISLAPPLLPERTFLVEQVCRNADQVFTLEIQPQAEQLALFK